MRPLEKLKALLESKGIYEQAVRLMRAHQKLKEAEDVKKTVQKAVKKPKKQQKKQWHDDDRDAPRDHPHDQMDDAWNEPGAPFRSGDY